MRWGEAVVDTADGIAIADGKACMKQTGRLQRLNSRTGNHGAHCLLTIAQVQAAAEQQSA